MIEDDGWIRELFTGSHDGVFEDMVKVEVRMAAARAAEAVQRAEALAAETARLAGVKHWLKQHKDYAAIPDATYRIIGGCGRCGGKGWISAFTHIKGGECFACGGQG